MRSRDQEDPDTTGSFGLERGNPNTLFFPDEPGATAVAPSPREAFLVAYARLYDLAMAARKPSFVIGAVNDQMQLVGSDLVEANSPITIGRHTKCRIRLPSEPVSLRHVVALVIEEEPGRPMLRVWDLNTRLPFTTEDGEKNCALVSDGPTYFSIGSFAIWCLPCGNGEEWPPRGVDAWSALPPRTMVDRRAAVPGARRDGVIALPLLRRRKGGPYRDFDEPSRVTTLAPPLLLGDDEEPEIAWATIRLQSRKAKAKRNVSAERLEQGLLIGRYERCGLSLGEIDKSVSRVHLLLVRIGASVWAIDTGSSNGVRKDKKNIAAIVLQNADRLEFGAHMILDWHKIEHAEA